MREKQVTDLYDAMEDRNTPAYAGKTKFESPRHASF